MVLGEGDKITKVIHLTGNKHLYKICDTSFSYCRDISLWVILLDQNNRPTAVDAEGINSHLRVSDASNTICELN